MLPYEKYTNVKKIEMAKNAILAKKNGLSYGKFARTVDVEPSTLSKWITYLNEGRFDNITDEQLEMKIIPNGRSITTSSAGTKYGKSYRFSNETLVEGMKILSGRIAKLDLKIDEFYNFFKSQFNL